MLFLLGLSYGLGGVIAAAMLSHAYIGPLGVCITALGLVETMQLMFKRHRDISWASGADAAQPAAAELLGNLLSVLLGVVSAFAIFASNFQRGTISKLFSFQINGVFIHQLVPYSDFATQFGAAMLSGIALAGLAFFLAAIYKESGIAFLMSWIGSLWGIGLVMSFRSVETADAIDVALVMLSLATGSISFLSAGITGLFMGRGALKYPITSKEYRAIVHTSLSIFAGAISFLLVSAVLSAAVGARLH